nr:polycomb protein esc [Quercus suber]
MTKVLVPCNTASDHGDTPCRRKCSRVNRQAYVIHLVHSGEWQGMLLCQFYGPNLLELRKWHGWAAAWKQSVRYIYLHVVPRDMTAPCSIPLRCRRDDRLYDVKFYPFPTADDEQIFAAAGTGHCFVARINAGTTPPYEILRWWHDLGQGDASNHKAEDGKPSSANLNSLVWTRDVVTGHPQICVAGAFPKQILIFDVVTGHQTRTLVGHGRGINDLAISPLSERLLATASEDYTIRLWNLAPTHEKQPCVATFAGEGHKQPVLAIGFHANGRWLLSGGLDTAFCLWAVPPQDLSPAKPSQGHDKPVVVYHPHFYSTEVHHNYIDNVVFYGDLILSRAACDPKVKENEIILWKIDGFNGDADDLRDPPVPGENLYTRSAFPHSSRSRGFQRLLSFETPSTDRFYSRFGLFHQPDLRVILVMGTQQAKYLFWDLQRLEEGYDPSDESVPTTGKPRSRKGKGRANINSENLNRLEDLRKGSHSLHSDTGESRTRKSPSLLTSPARQLICFLRLADRSSTSISAPPERKYRLDDPFTPLKPHYSIAAPTRMVNKKFGTSAIAFSPDGLWMVSVGDEGMMCLFHRDGKVM